MFLQPLPSVGNSGCLPMVMESNHSARLVGWDIHGFRTMEDLDIVSITKEAGSRWLRPNEIHAILSNHAIFTVKVKPVNLPMSGTIVLFDRKMLRNFRKDGHNWRKKKDGKTVKEAHEHLKVGSEERIHVYYAHGEDDPKFVRRCYWLLDKSLEHIVLVHYRQTQELQGSPVTPANSQSASDLSDLSASRLLHEETDTGGNGAFNVSDSQRGTAHRDGTNVSAHEQRLRELNTLEWDELLASNEFHDKATPAGDTVKSFLPQDRHAVGNLQMEGGNLYGLSNLDCLQLQKDQMNDSELYKTSAPMIIPGDYLVDNLSQHELQGHDSFGRWMNDIIADSPGSVDDPTLGWSLPTAPVSEITPLEVKQTPISPIIFHIMEVSHSRAQTNEETKILLIGSFCQEYKHLESSNVFCICGDTVVPAENVQVGVYRCLVSCNAPGLTNLFLSLDGCNPMSQILSFEFCTPVSNNTDFTEDKSTWEMLHIQMRLSRLLLSTSKILELSDNEVSQNAIKEATKFSLKCANIANSWSHLTKLIENDQITFSEAKERLFEITLKNRLKEWLIERVILGSKISEHDSQGQGVLHLCSILGYTWAVYPYSLSGLSLDFRDKFGWTALHWAAYYGREKMVGALLSAGAKPNLVTDPTADNPGGMMAADLAYKKGYDGVAAYLSEKALVQQFEDMKIAGNVSGVLETATEDSKSSSYCDSYLNCQNEDEIYLKDTLTAYRTAADAAARIQLAFRQRSLNLRSKALQSSSPEMEARGILAAMRIQHAYRSYEMKKKMAAAARIQYRFRTWKLRREFLHMRKEAIKIQAVFRGFQVRSQYRKILWSVGVLEKAVLRWRKKRKGFRGLQVEPAEPATQPSQDSDPEEDFYRASRKQAEERVEKAVVRVQAMFRSKQAQQEYRRMKLAYDQAKADFSESVNSSVFMD